MGFKKNEVPPTEKISELKPHVAPVTRALILICEKCGSKLVADGAENPSRILQKALKEQIRATGRRGEIRAVVSSCMDICPEGEIAVGFSPTSSEAAEYFTLAGDLDLGLEKILGRV
jgi:predicted metal-binding protein